MLMQMLLMLASQQGSGGGGGPTPPAMTSLTITSSNGTCITTPLQPAVVTVSWTASNYDSSLYDFKLYQDDILKATQDSTSAAFQQAGLVQGDTHCPEDRTFNFRVDIVRTSDSVVISTMSGSNTFHYGRCAGAAC